MSCPECQPLAAPIARRCQRGSKLYDYLGAKAYHGSAAAATAAHPASRNHRGLRPQRGNPATNYDDNPATLRKSLRPQIGKIYDDKKVGNTYEQLEPNRCSVAAISVTPIAKA